MSAGRWGNIARWGLLGAVCLAASAGLMVTNGARIGARYANLLARAACLARMESARAPEIFTELAPGGGDYAVVKDETGTVVWRSPGAESVSLPEATDKLGWAKLSNGSSVWLVKASVDGRTAIYAGRRNAYALDLLRFVGVPFGVIFLPFLAAVLLYPASRIR